MEVHLRTGTCPELARSSTEVLRKRALIRNARNAGTSPPAAAYQVPVDLAHSVVDGARRGDKTEFQLLEPLLVVLTTGLLLIAACGPLTSKTAAISAGETAVGAVKVSRADAKEMTWADWQRRSETRGGPVPAPSGSTKVWVVAVEGRLTKLRNAPVAVVILNATTGDMIMATTSGTSWPAYWGSL
jgi:hypothetical protein